MCDGWRFNSKQMYDYGLCSSKFYDYPSTRLTVTGVTGTNGKTSVSQFIAALLNMNKRRCGVIGTLGYGLLQTRPEVLSDTGFTTPDAVALQACFAELYAQGADSVAMEVSSHSLDQHRIDGIDVDIAIFTNLSHDHLDYHGNFADYARAKQRLFELPSVKHKVINIDDEVGRTIALNIPDAISYSLKDPAARIFAQQIKYHEHGFAVSLKTPWGEGETLVPLLGEFNLSNCLAVIAALGSQGIALGDILSSLPKLSPVPGRMQIFPTASDEPSVLIDYAHTPDALKNALLALRAHCKGQLWCVFGCGGDRDMAKRPTMGFEAGKYADIVVVTSDNPRSENPQRIIRDILGGIIDQSDTVIEENRAAAISLVIAQAQPEDVVLIAGKGHETYQEIAGQKNHFNDYEQIALAFSRRRQEGLSL